MVKLFYLVRILKHTLYWGIDKFMKRYIFVGTYLFYSLNLKLFTDFELRTMATTTFELRGRKFNF